MALATQSPWEEGHPHCGNIQIYHHRNNFENIWSSREQTPVILFSCCLWVLNGKDACISAWFITMYVVRLQNCEGLLSGDIRGFVLPTWAATVAFLKLHDGVARNGCRFNLEIKLFPQILHVEPHFVRKNCPAACKLQFNCSLHIGPHFVRKGCVSEPGLWLSRCLRENYMNRTWEAGAFAHRTSFRAKRLRFAIRSLAAPPIVVVVVVVVFVVVVVVVVVLVGV